MYQLTDLEDLTWHIPPECAGQGVEYAYAIDPAGLFRRIIDFSAGHNNPERIEYSWISWDLLEEEEDPEPWNGEPSIDNDLWVNID